MCYEKITLFLFFALAALLYSCNIEKSTSVSEVNNPLETRRNFNVGELQITYNTEINDVENLDISIAYNNMRIDFSTNIEGVSTLNVTDSQISLFDTRITINPCLLNTENCRTIL